MWVSYIICNEAITGMSSSTSYAINFCGQRNLSVSEIHN